MKTKLGQLIVNSQKSKMSSLQNSEFKNKHKNNNHLGMHNCESINIISSIRNHELHNENISNKQTDSLYTQNYRLIQSNFKLVNQMVGLVDFVKKYLKNAVRLIDNFRYLQTTKVIHQIVKKVEQYQQKGSEFGLNLSFKQFSRRSKRQQQTSQIQVSPLNTPDFNPESFDKIQSKTMMQMYMRPKASSESFKFCKLADVKIKPTKIQSPIILLGQNLFEKDQFSNSVEYVNPTRNLHTNFKNYSSQESGLEFGFQGKERSVKSQNIIGKGNNKYDPKRFKLQGKDYDLYYMLLIQACSFQEFIQS